MATEHPGPDELAALSRGDLSPERARILFRHLLRCKSCKAEFVSCAALMFPLTAEEDAAYDAVLDRVARTARRYHRRLQARKAEVKRLGQILASGGIEAVHRLPRKVDQVALFEALLARSWSLRHHDTSLMEQFAWLALQQADNVDARVYGSEATFDLRCRAWAELGNAYRVGEKLEPAVWALGRAREVFELGTGDPALEIRVVELEASLAADRRQFRIARFKLSKVFQFYWRRGDEHQAGRTLILQGLYSGYAGEPEEGIRLLKKGLTLLNADLDPGLVYAALHNQLLFLIDCGRFREAKKFRVQRSRELSLSQDRLNQVKLRWLDGRIDIGLGNYARARNTLAEVKKALQDDSLSYQVALASLDLTASLLILGKQAEAQEVALDAARTFISLGIDREALAAVVLLREAFEIGRATADFVQDVAAFLRRAEFDPDARFDPADL